MSFFTFSQNNSGGVFDGPEYVIIEADSAEEANIIAMDHGIYFDGVQHKEDCPCCGDRWREVDDYDATDKPEIWGKDPEDHKNHRRQSPTVKTVRKQTAR